MAPPTNNSTTVLRTQNRVAGILFFGLLALAPYALADEVRIDYIDSENQNQVLIVNVDSSEAENALAATLILAVQKITILPDEKEDLALIAEAVSSHAPDAVTATAISNTILGINTDIGGQGVVPGAQSPIIATPPTDTPPVTPVPPPPLPPSTSMPPPPSSSVVSPN